MINEREERRVVLIYGDPNHGKTFLADQLKNNFGYHKLDLDDIYVKFIENQYEDFNFPGLNKVIAEHFYRILVPLDQRGFARDAVATWQDHVASLTEAATQQHQLVAVEGYLLLPALDAVQEKLADKAIVTMVEVRNRQYFVAWSVEQIHGK